MCPFLSHKRIHVYKCECLYIITGFYREYDDREANEFATTFLEEGFNITITVLYKPSFAYNKVLRDTHEAAYEACKGNASKKQAAAEAAVKAYCTNPANMTKLTYVVVDGAHRRFLTIKSGDDARFNIASLVRFLTVFVNS